MSNCLKSSTRPGLSAAFGFVLLNAALVIPRVAANSIAEEANVGENGFDAANNAIAKHAFAV